MREFDRMRARAEEDFERRRSRLRKPLNSTARSRKCRERERNGLVRLVIEVR
jgi:hypothetical protein